MLAFLLQQAKTKYRSRVTQARGYLTIRGSVLVTENADPDYLAPK